MKDEGIFRGKNGQLLCYARAGRYRLETFVKTKEFRDYNALLGHLKHQKGTLVSYIDYNSFIKATIRYNK